MLKATQLIQRTDADDFTETVNDTLKDLKDLNPQIQYSTVGVWDRITYTALIIHDVKEPSKKGAALPPYIYGRDPFEPPSDPTAIKI